MQEMNDELKAAEAKYAPRFKEAEKIADENLRRVRIEGLRNSFGTKQSMIRKKYGVRLRERRTKAEIMAERERMGLKRAEKERARASLEAQRTSSPITDTEPAPRPAGGSGWTAANTSRASSVWEEHNAKRRRVDESGAYHSPYTSAADETLTRKTLSVSEIGGGLSGSAATAATHDPTLPPPSQPTRVYEQSSARIEIHEPSNKRDGAARNHSESASPASSDEGVGGGRDETTPGIAEKEPADVVGDDPSSSSGDEDIPPTLPTHVRKSLGAGSTSLLQGA
jgi:hypothetical protein